jgi:hypothetical protein
MIMKLLTILVAATLALPGTSWSQPVAELEHLSESAVNSAAHEKKPGLMASVIRGASEFAKKIVIVKTIPLYENVELPFPLRGAQAWKEFVKSGGRMNEVVKRIYSKERAAEYFSPDGELVKKELDILARYVKESRLDNLGRVRRFTYLNAKFALMRLISFEFEHGIVHPASINIWKLPEYARVRLKEMFDGKAKTLDLKKIMGYYKKFIELEFS